VERSDLLIVIYLPSPEQQLISLHALHGHWSLCVLTTSRKVEPENHTKLGKATPEAHFIPLLSSKMGNNRKPPFLLSTFLSF